MILHASELATELFDEVQSPRCSTFAISIATAKLPAFQVCVTCMVLRVIQNGVTNIQLTTGRDREIAGTARLTIDLVSLKTSCKLAWRIQKTTT